MKTQETGQVDSLMDHEMILRALKQLLADSQGCRRRVRLMFDAISIAQQYIKEQEISRFSLAVAHVEERAVTGELTIQHVEALGKAIDVISTESAFTLSSSMRAASIILSHSCVDDTLNRALMLCIMFEPWSWRGLIHKASTKRYTLTELDNVDLKQVEVSALQNYLVKAKHLSITKRSHLLLNKIGPADKQTTISRVDESTLGRFDKLRHGLIHSNLLKTTHIDEESEQDCFAILGHCENVIYSLAEYCRCELRQEATL